MPKVIFPFVNTGIGGSHISATILAEALSKRPGYEVEVVAPKGALVLEECRKRCIPSSSVSLPSFNRAYYLEFYKAFFHYKEIRSYCERDDTIIHCNDLGALSTWGVLGKFLGAKIVYHDRQISRRMFPRRLFTSFANHIISISVFCEKKITYVPKVKKSTIVNPFEMKDCVDSDHIKHGLLEELDVPMEVKLIGFSGNFWFRKRPEFFLDMAAELKLIRSDVAFVMFGREGDYTEEEILKMVTAKGLEDICLVAGFRQPGADHIAALDLLCATAIDEPFGRTPLEALFNDLPYVVTDDAGHGEILRTWGGGAGVDVAANPAKFAKVVDKVLRNPDSYRKSPSQKNEVARDLSVQKHTDDIIKVYEAISEGIGLSSL